ncbi:MAG TPA: hypothetical protein VK537_05980 [Galbitalea sp.]|nr:hypothetical protein [Galbitalea sp.]
MSTRSSTRTVRILLFAVSVATLAWVLGAVVFGTVDLATQLANHTIRPTMYWATDQVRFTDQGDGQSGVDISGEGGAVTTSVTGVSTSTIAIFAAATIVRLLIQLVLGVLALMLLGRLRSGRPFAKAAWRLVAALSVVVLAFAIISQLLAWWSRLAIIRDAGGDTFSTAFVFDPLTVTIGLTLALVALAFRFGEQLERDAEGLV